MSSTGCMQLEGEDMLVEDPLEEDSVVLEWVEDSRTTKMTEEYQRATNAEVQITLLGTVMPRV